MSRHETGRFELDEPEITDFFDVDGPLSCAKYLGFPTINDFCNFLDSSSFRPFYEQYDQWDTQQNLHQVSVEPFFTILDLIVSRDKKSRTQYDHGLVTGQPSPWWRRVEYILSTILQVFYKNYNASRLHCIGQEFPAEPTPARWNNIWNIFRFCVKYDYFSAKSQMWVRSCSLLEHTIVAPSYMALSAESEDKAKDRGYRITWENMPVNTPHALLEIPMTVLLPARCFDSYRILQHWITDQYGLLWRKLKIDHIEFRVLDGSETFEEAERRGSPWRTLLRYVQEGRAMSFSFYTTRSPMGSSNDEYFGYKAPNASAFRRTYVIEANELTDEEWERPNNSEPSTLPKKRGQPSEDLQPVERQRAEPPKKLRKPSTMVKKLRRIRQKREPGETQEEARVANEVDQRSEWDASLRRGSLKVKNWATLASATRIPCATPELISEDKPAKEPDQQVTNPAQ
ncbi:hypothetical protein LTR84_003203 [Exophiala bonariae]|uniref:Aminotransferase-like plant mobile domain-containing protein n=1 Tax=Exophiala bonariae TaxID=1690606 RepID=A0AAV9N853_9EURO|nr:hypothetical protein LTR84_003203 [Exophiala bonariae]